MLAVTVMLIVFSGVLFISGYLGHPISYQTAATIWFSALGVLIVIQLGEINRRLK